jgi:UDP-glucuronate 4-epimerase
MHILVTGAAGFIGFHLSKKLLEDDYKVLGIDNLNNYYDPNLKIARLNELQNHQKSSNFEFINLDLSNKDSTENLFASSKIDVVIHLAAQAGVRYSIENPHTYIDSNILGFINVLEGCRALKINHLVYASSSSVYGMNNTQPFSTNDVTDYPISLYAATKKSNELMSFAYSHLYKIPSTGLRFFTVYGPFGRPDMAYFKFTKSILNEEKIDIYNKGAMKRDFTYIDDIVDGIMRVITSPPKPNVSSYSSAEAPHAIYNIGNNDPITLIEFIEAIEDACNKKAIKEYLPMQPGDVPVTFANIDPLINHFKFKPKTDIKDGISNFVKWYRDFYE